MKERELGEKKEEIRNYAGKEWNNNFKMDPLCSLGLRINNIKIKIDGHAWSAIFSALSVENTIKRGVFTILTLKRSKEDFKNVIAKKCEITKYRQVLTSVFRRKIQISIHHIDFEKKKQLQKRINKQMKNWKYL